MSTLPRNYLGFQIFGVLKRAKQKPLSFELVPEIEGDYQTNLTTNECMRFP